MPVDKNRLKDLFSHGHRISFEEFCQVMHSFTPSPTVDSYFHETFRAFDKNSDGFITVKEIQRTMKELGERLTYKQAKQMLKEADLNGDGKLSREEFRLLFNQLNEYAHSPPQSPNEQATSSFPIFQ